MYSLLEFHLFCSAYIISFPKVIQNIRKNKTKKIFSKMGLYDARFVKLQTKCLFFLKGLDFKKNFSF